MKSLLAKLRPRGWWVLWTVLGLGLLLRVCVMIFYTPTVFNYYGGDSTRYMRLGFVGITGLFGDNAMPAGYPAFLAGLREISTWLPLTTMIQHLLGLATAALLYSAVVRAGAPRWAALLPAIVVCLSGDQIFLEHAMLTEALWMPFLALGMYLTARCISAEDPRRWLAIGGAALACSALVRHVSLGLPALLTLWAVIALPGSWRVRLQNGVSLLLPAMLVVGAYFFVSTVIAGGYSGITENQGLSLYGRVGQFADCTKFTAPAGTSRLCIHMPPDKRPGPFFWTFGGQSPLHTKVQFNSFDSSDQELVASFGREAILHQPWDYLEAVTTDIARYFGFSVGVQRFDSGTDAQNMSFGSDTPVDQGVTLEGLASQFDEAYSGVGNGTTDQTVRTLLGGYQSVFRMHGILTLLLILLAAAGWILGYGAMRAGASLFLLAGLLLLTFPPLFSSYDVRYAVQPINLFSAGAAFGLAVLVGRLSPAWSARYSGIKPKRAQSDAMG
jgi:hypothetical protein